MCMKMTGIKKTGLKENLIEGFCLSSLLQSTFKTILFLKTFFVYSCNEKLVHGKERGRR